MVFGFGFGLGFGLRRSNRKRTTASELNDDVLLSIFDWYRLYDTTNEDQSWNLERWWYNPIHVCRQWRHLILTSPTRLDLHLVCTYGIPVEAMLSHSPPLPLIIYYPAIPGQISAVDEEGAMLALLQHERVHRIHVTAPTTVLCNFFKAMDCEFPILETLSLHLSTETRTGLELPKKLLAPLLLHLTLSNISLPIQSRLLRQAEGLITLRLWNVPASSEFNPAHLVAQLLGMSRLEILMVQFYTPIPKRRFESPAQPTPITLPSLKVLAFRGGSTYLEGILARIDAPLLSTLNVEFFNQLTFNLSRMLEFVRRTGEFRFRSIEMQFDKEFVSVIVDPQPERAGSNPLFVQVKCQPLGWQAACASQICHALEPVLGGVERLTLRFHKDSSVPWKDEIDVEMWHGLLRTFAGVQSLRPRGGLVGDLFRSLQLDEEELPLDLLPQLREIIPVAPALRDTARRDTIFYDPHTFRKHVKNIGRAYREQATTLIEICRLYVEASPQTYIEDDSLQNIFRLADAALSAAGEHKMRRTPEVADAFLCVQKEIIRFGSPPPEEAPRHRKRLSDTSTALANAAKKDEKTTTFFSKVKSVFKAPPPRGSVKNVKFVILESPHERRRDQLVVIQTIDNSTTISEIIWRFSRYPVGSDMRIASRQNPHFYLGLSEDAASYGNNFHKDSLQGEFGHGLENDSTVYVLVDKSCRLFLDAHKPFGNLWKPHQSVILKDVRGVLESEDIVLSKIGKSQDYWHRPSISDPSQRRTYSKNDSEIVKKPVENWRALLDAALSSQDVDLMIRDRDKPLPPEDSDWRPLPSPEPSSAGVPVLGEQTTPGQSTMHLPQLEYSTTNTGD